MAIVIGRATTDDDANDDVDNDYGDCNNNVDYNDKRGDDENS